MDAKMQEVGYFLQGIEGEIVLLSWLDGEVADPVQIGQAQSSWRHPPGQTTDPGVQ